MIGRGPRERCRSVPRGGVKKKKGSVAERKQYRCVPRGVVKEEKEKNHDKSWTEREVSLFPSIRYK